MSEHNIKMTVFSSKPTGFTIFNKDNFPQEKKMMPFVVGEGVLDFTCGGCDHKILKSIRWGQITRAIYKCPKCGAYNQIDQAAKKH